ncbi:inner centromere protein [Erythrolamprus reginae]|uniref:inner centromere protein n=1 Tax=Erythrolamprus reginae TaxID=121349 RepID=UPI00396CAEB6
MVNILNLKVLEDKTNKKITQFIQNVDNRDFLWMDEVFEEAIKVTKSSDGEPELMPKTPSQKNRRRKKSDQPSTRRSSKRNSAGIRASKRISQNAQRKKELEIQKAELENISPCVRVTRSRTARSLLVAAVKNPVIDLVKGRIALVEISANERRSAELQIEKKPSQPAKVALSNTLSEKSVNIIQETPEEKLKKEIGRTICKLKIAKVSLSKTIEKEDLSAEKLYPQQQEDKPLSEPEATLNLKESSQTPIVPQKSRRSVRRSLMGRISTSSRASLANRYSLSTKREQIILRRSSRTVSKQRSVQQSSVCTIVNTEAITETFPDKESTESRATLESTPNFQKADENLNQSRCSNKTAMPEAPQSKEKQHKGDKEEGTSEMSDELLKQPLSARRKPSYKRAIRDRDDGQHTEDEHSPPRKKIPSPQCRTSKMRPFKTFLHTVQKNQMLMTPVSINRNSTIKSFLRQNTPLRFTPQEKERQRLENLRKKAEAEQNRKRRLEEEKIRRLEEFKRKREERLQKALQVRVRGEQLEEEKKKRREQKLAQHEEKNEKIREEKMAESKNKKMAVAKKMEELEARRKQEEEARRQKALQLEEEERRNNELMQKKREEEQERVRKIAEQHKAELERQRELEKKQEQEKIQAQRKHEQQEKEKAARLQVEQAAKEKERLRKEIEEKERKLQEQRKQEDELLKTTLEARAKKQLNVTVDIENSSICNSYPMTPQSHKQPKIDVNDYGMDLNSDDSTDDESHPRKTIPIWASGNQLCEAIRHQYYNPPNYVALFGVVKSPKLEEIFNKSKPRFFKRTSSAVWNSPPFQGGKAMSSAFKRF